MKLLLPTILLLATQIYSHGLRGINSKAFQCSLSVEVSPLEYIIVTRSMSIELRFSSNCLRLRDFLFEVPFTLRDRMSMKKHPKILELHIFRNKYMFSFTKRDEEDMNTISRRYSYQKVTLSPSKRPTSMNVATSMPNSVYLEEQKKGSFNIKKLNRLLYADSPIRCDVDSKMKRMRMICKLN